MAARTGKPLSLCNQLLSPLLHSGFDAMLLLGAEAPCPPSVGTGFGTGGKPQWDRILKKHQLPAKTRWIRAFCDAVPDTRKYYCRLVRLMAWKSRGHSWI